MSRPIPRSIPRDEAERLERWYRGIAADYRAAARCYPEHHEARHWWLARLADEEADRYAELVRVKGAA